MSYDERPDPYVSERTVVLSIDGRLYRSTPAMAETILTAAERDAKYFHQLVGAAIYDKLLAPEQHLSPGDRLHVAVDTTPARYDLSQWRGRNQGHGFSQ